MARSAGDFLMWRAALVWIGFCAVIGGTLLIGRASPPAPWLTYTREIIPGVGDIILHDLERDIAYNLTRTPDRMENRAAWSPDGSRLAFECIADDGLMDICLAGESTPPTPSRFQPGSWLHRPRWSPDGRWLAYVARTTSAYVLHAVDLTATPPVNRVVGGVDSAMNYTWSPDSAALAFNLYTRTASRIFASAVDVDRPRPTELEQTPFSNYFAAWSPDGGGIAFVSTMQGYKQRLHLLDPDGVVHPLTDGGLIGNDFSPVWSPDGSRLAFLSDRDGADFDLFILDMADRTLRQITVNYYLDENPAWSPDGRRIALMSNRDGGFHIYVIDLETFRTRRVTFGRGIHNYPAWRTMG
jgi:Tol biopolymer transport system component